MTGIRVAANITAFEDVFPFLVWKRMKDRTIIKTAPPAAAVKEPLLDSVNAEVEMMADKAVAEFHEKELELRQV